MPEIICKKLRRQSGHSPSSPLLTSSSSSRESSLRFVSRKRLSHPFSFFQVSPARRVSTKKIFKFSSFLEDSHFILFDDFTKSFDVIFCSGSCVSHTSAITCRAESAFSDALSKIKADLDTRATCFFVKLAPEWRTEFLMTLCE